MPGGQYGMRTSEITSWVRFSLSNASKLEQAAQANAVSYPQLDGKWVVSYLLNVTCWGGGMSASCTAGLAVRWRVQWTTASEFRYCKISPGQMSDAYKQVCSPLLAPVSHIVLTCVHCTWEYKTKRRDRGPESDSGWYTVLSLFVINCIRVGFWCITIKNVHHTHVVSTIIFQANLVYSYSYSYFY